MPPRDSGSGWPWRQSLHGDFPVEDWEPENSASRSQRLAGNATLRLRLCMPWWKRLHGDSPVEDWEP
ncbi:MAG: hypothetical protein AAGA75_14095, partial [Cyanobacteria bacterium P01_E01_bin.6]